MASQHHDTGYKELFGHPEFVQQLVEGFAPLEIAGLMDFSTLKIHSGNYIGRYTDQELAARHTPLSGVFGIENASRDLEALQQAVDRVVAIIRAGPNKERTDAIITRWLKRHLQRLGARIDLEKLNSLVEERDMLAENLDNWAEIERRQGGCRVLLRQLNRRFGELPSWVSEELDAASAETLDAWADQILVAETLDELFGR